jgi:hypothetical protein
MNVYVLFGVALTETYVLALCVDGSGLSGPPLTVTLPPSGGFARTVSVYVVPPPLWVKLALTVASELSVTVVLALLGLAIVAVPLVTVQLLKV